MRHQLLPATTTSTSTSMAPSSSSSSPSLLKPHKKPTSASPLNSPNCPCPNSLCKHPPSATLDLLILLLVLFSGAFLLASYLSYIFNSLSLLLPSFSLHSFLSSFISHLQAQPVFYLSLISSFILVLISFRICCRHRSRKCGKFGCKGLKNAMEFDLKLLGEESLKLGKSDKIVKEIDELPWKGGSEFNPDYEVLREELRKMAPPNGRAVLLFRSKCGCPKAKLEGWGPKRSRRQKKSLPLHGAEHR